MSAEDVLARHVEYGHDHRCHIDGNPMPCDAVLMARALAESERRADGLGQLISTILRKYGGTMKGRGDHDIFDALVRSRAALLEGEPDERNR